jgi:DNA-binding CsgD family transcriptional regulator
VIEVGADWPLVGRREEMARLQSSIAARAGGGVILAGPAGAGKTSLARWCVDQATTLGYRAEWLFGAETTAPIPLGAFVPVLPASAAVGSAEGLFQAVHQLFRGREEKGPVLLAVDDGHLLDEISALLVHQLATAGTTLVVVTLRSGGTAPEPLLELWKDALVERMELPPLNAGDVEELLSGVLGGPVDMALCHQLWRASAGNPLFLRELLMGARGQNLLQDRDGTWCLVGDLPSSPRLVELVESRLGGLPGDAREALELLAVGEPLRLAHVEELIPLELLTRLDNDLLLRIGPGESEEVVQLAHPVYGDVLRASMPRLRVRHLRLILADSLERAGRSAADDLERMVRWRVAAGAAVPADQLLSAGRRALSRFDVDFARRCADEAYGRQRTTRTGLLLGQSLVLAKAHDEAEAVLAEVEALAVDDDEILGVAQARADNLFHWLGRSEDARSVVERAQGKVASEAARLLLTVQRGWFDLFDGDPSSALEEIETILTHRDRHVQLCAAVLATRACMAMGQFGRGLGLAERVAAAEHLTGAVPGVDPPLMATAELFALTHSGRLDDAERRGRAAHAGAIESGAATARGWFADLLGTAALLQGRVATAERWFREAFTAMTRFGADPRARVAKAAVAHCLALRGETVEARACLSELDRVPGRSWRLLETEVRAQAWTDAAEGELTSARDRLHEAAYDQRRGGGHVFEAALLHDAVRLGNPLPETVERLEALCDVVEGELMTARARHARALGDDDPTGLSEAATAFERIGAVLFAAEAAAAAAQSAERRGSSREATALGRRAHDLAGRCEGARTPALHEPESAALPALTDRELEIATLAAEGLPSKTIAARLFLSARTVDNYLGRVFTKLGVTNRSQLAELLRSD